MLLPALARSRENARRTSCIGNQKQIGTYLSVYLHDNRDVFGYIVERPAGLWWLWSDQLRGGMTYANIATKKNREFFCPSIPLPADSDNRDLDHEKTYGMFYPRGESYGLPTKFYHSWTDGSTTMKFLVMNKATNVSRMPIFACSYRLDKNEGYYLMINGASNDKGFFGAHLGAGNIVFGDGHVGSVKAREYGELIRAVNEKPAYKPYYVSNDLVWRPAE